MLKFTKTLLFLFFIATVFSQETIQNKPIKSVFENFTVDNSSRISPKLQQNTTLTLSQNVINKEISNSPVFNTAIFNEFTPNIITVYQEPSAIQILKVNNTSTTISWQDTNQTQPYGWECVIQSIGEGYPDSKTPVLSVKNQIVTLTELLPGNSYEIFIRSNFGNANYSNWSKPVTIQTPLTGCTSPQAGNTCDTATNICTSQNLDGYCGTTSGSYSADHWPELNTAFCGSIENNSFLTFIATTSTISMDVVVDICVSGSGVQFMMFSAATCGSGSVSTVSCYSPMNPGTSSLTFGGLTPGNTYYLMIDGFAKAVCDYSITLTDPSTGVDYCTVDLGVDQLYCNASITDYTLTANSTIPSSFSGVVTYSWFLDGVLQATTTTNTYTVSQSGTWTVEVEFPWCCETSTDDALVIFSSPPILNTPSPQIISSCGPYDLTSLIPNLVAPENPSDFNVYFYLDIVDCWDGNTNYITNPTAFYPNGNVDVYIRVENVGNPICSNTDEYITFDCNCILQLVSATNSDDQTICLGDAISDIIFQIGGNATSANSTGLPAGLTQSFDTSTNLYTISGTPLALGTYTFDVSTIGCPTETVRPVTITVSGPPIFNSLTAVTSPICEGLDAVFNLSGSPNATVNYTINGGGNQSILLDSSGNIQVIIPNCVADQTIQISDITIGSCVTPANQTETITVIPTPVITSLVGNGPLCENQDIVYTIEGTPNATVDYHYTLDGGLVLSGTITLDSTGEETITIANAAPGTYNLILDTITFSSCSASIDNHYSVFVNADPAVSSLTGNGPLCSGQNAVFSIVGNPTTTLTYSINGGATQTTTLSAAGTTSITVYSPSSNVTLSLLTLSTLGCTAILTDTLTITVGGPQLTSLTPVDTQICNGDNAAFEIVGTPNAQVYYSLNGGATTSTTLNTSGEATVTIPAATSNQTIVLSNISLSSCSNGLNNSATITVNPAPTFTSVTGTTPICGGDNAVFEFQGSANATINFDINGNPYSTTLDASGNGTYTVTNPTADQIITLNDITIGSCTATLTDTYTIVVGSSPSFTSLTSNTPICQGENAIFTFEGTPNATVNYTINGNPNSITLDVSGEYMLTETTPVADVTVTLVDIVLGSCTVTDNSSETVTVNSSPSFTSLSGVSPICQGNNAVFEFQGSANATINFDINGTTNSVTLDASGYETYTVTAPTVDQTITLNDITIGSCTSTLTNTHTIVVNPTPSFTSLISNTPICQGENAIFTFQGTPNATVNYTLNGNPNSIILDTSGQYILTEVNPIADVTITLADIELNNCTTSDNTSETVTINPLPTVSSVTSNSPICSGENAVFTVNATPNTTITYTLDGGTTTTALNIPASGTNTITVYSATANQTIQLIDITDNTTLCSDLISNTAAVTINPLPTASMTTASNAVCLNGTTTLTFTGTPNAEVTFTDGTNNYTVTLDASGTVDFTTPMLTVDTAFSLVDVTLPATGCWQTISGSETIVISPTPEITGVTYTTEICEGTLTDIVVNLNNATGYTWVATLANIDATAVNQTGDQTDINQVFNLQNPLIPGYVTIAIQPELVGGNCAGVVETIQITINPVPEITNIVESATEICNNETVHFELSGEPSGLEYQWTAILTGVMTDDGVTSGIITSNELELTLVLVNPNTQGSFYVEFTPVLGSCVGTTVNSEVITVNPIPGSVVASPTIPICSGDTAANAFDIQLGFPLITGTTVEWVVFDSSGVSGATDGSSATTPFEINDVLTATGSSPGYVTYRIWTISPAGCQGGYVDFTVVVNPNPMPVLQGGSICVDGSGATFQSFWLQASGNFTANSEFVWYEASDTTSPIAITTIPQLEIFDIGSYYVEVTNQDTNCMGTSDAVPVVATSPATLVETTVTDYFSDSATVIVTATVDNGYLLYQMDEGGYQDSNVFTGVSSGEHTVEVIDSQGCTYLTTTVMVIDYPKYFTPNGDGYNDTWNITGLNQPDAKLYIFDRYGKLLKQISATDASNGWDGTYNGNQMPSTDYWFSLQYTENNVAKEFKAHFALKR